MTFLISTVTLLIVTYATVWALCRIAAKPTPRIPKPEYRIRPFPQRTPACYAEGRPTMPSQPEPEDEFKRRTR